MNVNRNIPQRILVLFPGSLGDFVCALPALESIKNGKEIVLAVRGTSFELSSTLPFVEKTFSLELRIFSQLFTSPQKSSAEIQQFLASFSEIVSWYGHSHTEVVENLLLFSLGNVRSFLFFTGQEDCHAVSYYLQCVGEKILQCPSVEIPKESRLWGECYWRQHQWHVSSRILLLHPGSGGTKKCWTPEGFRKVAYWWKTRRKSELLILLGPAESRETEEWSAIGQVVSGLSVSQVAALLSQADLYLGNDSGISHLAGAVGARGVVLFGPTRPHQWRPLGGNLLIVQSTTSQVSSPLHAGISLDEIPAEVVIEKLIVQGG